MQVSELRYQQYKVFNLIYDRLCHITFDFALQNYAKKMRYANKNLKIFAYVKKYY